MQLFFLLHLNFFLGGIEQQYSYPCTMRYIVKQETNIKRRDNFALPADMKERRSKGCTGSGDLKTVARIV